MRLLVVACVTVVTRLAHADPAAEALFREGRDLVKAGKLDEACDRFARSEAIEPKVGTAFNLGDCRERQGLLADAWEAFVTSQSLASRDHDSRGAVAAERAAALAPKLAHLKIVVGGERPPGLTVARNGRPVAAAVLDTEIPVDPGTYELVATAPGYLARTAHVTLALGAHETSTIPALEVDPNAPVMIAPAFQVSPPLGRISVGAAFGGTSDSDIVGGVRFVASYPVPRGAIRATLQGLYTPLAPTPPDQYHHINLYGLTLGFDYLWAWGHGLASAGGLGVGMDIVDDDYENDLSTTNWAAARVSPIVVRLPVPNLEIGLHLMYVVPGKIVVGVLGADWFVW